MNQSQTAVKIRVGIFVLIALSLFIMALFYLGALGATKNPVRYYVRFEGSVVGLREGASDVTYKGVPVGVVSDIRVDPVDPQFINVGVDIDPSFRPLGDMTGTIIIVDLTGIRDIELQGGSAESLPLAPGGYIQGGKTVLEEVGNVGLTLVKQAAETMDQLNLMLSEENRHKINNTLTSIESISSNIANRIDELVGPDARGNLGGALSNLNQITSDSLTLPDEARSGLAEVTDLVADVRVNMSRIAENLNATLASARGLVEDPELNEAISALSGTLQKAQELLTSISGGMDGDGESLAGDSRTLIQELTRLTRSFNDVLDENREELRRIMTNMRLSSDNLREATQSLRSNPSAILRAAPPEERRP